MALQVIFSIDPTGYDQDITEHISIQSDICLYCLHDKSNRLVDEIKKSLEDMGYDLSDYFQIMKIYQK